MSASGVIRVLLVDDHPLMLEAMEVRHADAGGFEVGGRASSVMEAIERARSGRPDVVVLDLRLGTSDELDAARAILAEQPDIRVLVLSGLDDAAVSRAIEAGCAGFVDKGGDPRALIHQIRRAADGETVLSDFAVRAAVSRLRDPARRPARADLSVRELEVLGLVSEGMSNLEIAEKLYIAPSTVKTHLERIYEKLGVHDRTRAAVVALERGLLAPD